MKSRPTKTRPGAAAIVMVVLMSTIGLAVITSLLLSSSDLLLRGQSLRSSAQTFYWAEAGLNQTLYALTTAANPTAIGNATFTPAADTTVTVTVPPGAFPKTITAVASNTASHVQRQVQITVHHSSTGGIYGAVDGNGDFTLQNGASITGDVRTNGNILGSNNSVIHGTVLVGGSSHRLDNGIIDGDVQSYTIAGKASICGDAAYHSIDSGSNSSLDFLLTPKNPPCPNPLTPGSGTVISASPVTPTFPNPAMENFIAGIQSTASGGATVNSITIPNNGTQSFGPGVVTNDIVLNNNATLLLTGPVWVKGQINLDSPGAKIQIDPARGGVNDTIIASGLIKAKNNGIFSGSGHTTAGKSDSYLLVASRSNSTNAANPAINLSNNGTSVIFYAPFGLANLNNALDLKNATAQMISINNGTIVYDPAIQDLIFTGATSSYIVPGAFSWREN